MSIIKTHWIFFIIFTYSISNSYFSIIIWIGYLFLFYLVPFSLIVGIMEFKGTFNYLVLILKDSFSSFQTFYIPFFQDTFLLFSSYFFKGPIYWIEVFIGNNNINWYYCHYFSNIQFITFFILMVLFPFRLVLLYYHHILY